MSESKSKLKLAAKNAEQGDQPKWFGLNIYQRLFEAGREMGALAKESDAPGVIGGFKFHSHNAVTAAVRKKLEEWNILLWTSIAEAEEREPDYGGKVGVVNKTLLGVEVSFWCVDMGLKPDGSAANGSVMMAKGFGTGIDKRDLSSGKALSYAVKNILLKALGLDRADGVGAKDNEAAAEDFDF